MILNKLEDILNPTTNIWNNLNYKNLNAKSKLNIIINNNKLIHNFDDDIDTYILNGINYYDNLNSFPIFGKNKIDGYNYYTDNLKNDYILYGIKHINVNKKIIINILYQLLFPRIIIKTKLDLTEYLKENIKFLYEYKKETIDICVLFVCKRNLEKKFPINDIIHNNYYVYIPNTKESISICAKIFFCNGTIKFLEIQNFDYFLSKDFESSKKMFLKYRKWLNLNIDIINQSQFMLFSSIVLYLIGNRSINDLDLYIHTIPENIIKKTDEFKTNPIFKYIEYRIKNTENWPHYWNNWLDIWAQKSKAKYFEEILADHKYHFYFLGVKIISLECDVIRRLERSRPRAYADLIALKKRYSFPIQIPPIPNKIKKYFFIGDKSEEEINKLINDGGILNLEEKELYIEYDNDINKFIDTIIYALKLRYKMVFTIEEISRELNMNITLKKYIKIKKI